MIAMSPGGHKVPLILVPQVLLIFILVLVAAGLVGLDIQWRQEWRSLRLSLQVRVRSPVPRLGALACGQSQDLSSSLAPQDCKYL